MKEIKKDNSYRFSALVAVAICSMVIVTSLALGGVFSYSYINGLKNEFNDRVRAEGEEYSLEVYSFLHRAMARLEGLGRDNSIRVTMMLGVDYPLSEKLAEYDHNPPGVDYFIMRKNDEKIFSSSVNDYDEKLVKEALLKFPFRYSLGRDEDGQFVTVFSIPIRSRSEVVGSAACLVSLSGSSLASNIEKSVGGRMLFFEKGKAYDLLNGRSVDFVFGESYNSDLISIQLGDGVDGVLYRSSLVPGLSYFVPDSRLDEALYRTFLLLLPLFVTVIGLSVGVSLYISNKLTRPLKKIMNSAQNIADGENGSLDNKGSRLYEINALSSSLSSMLESIDKSKGLEQYQFFFENVGDLVCITDINGSFLEVNSAVQDYLDYSREELLFKTFFELAPSYERESLRMLLNSAMSGSEVGRFECSLTCRGGAVIYCEVRSRKIEFRGHPALLSVVRDVTDRKRDEEELRRYASELLRAKEVEEHNSAHMAETLKKLEDAMARAEVANRTKSQFLAQMSHEIRTPMNSILGMADMLFETRLTAEQESYVSIFRNSGRALMSLINDILDLSKIESGKLTLEKTRFNLDELVDEVAGIMSVAAWKKGLSFACLVKPGAPSLFVGDPTRIKQIIVNLLSNAIKFTSEGTVSLKVSCREDEGRNAILSFVVEDSGIGISEDKVDVIFDNFVQADSSTTRKYGGTGLGLSITRNLVELMGGEISVRNLHSGGAEFSADIFVIVAGEDDKRLAEVNEAVLKRKILVIEDSSLMRSYISDCFNEWGAVSMNVGDLSFSCTDDEDNLCDAELVVVSDRLGDGDGLSEVEVIKKKMGRADLNICTLSTSPGNSSNRPEVNELFGVKGSVRWPVTRGGLMQAMLDIFGSETATASKKDIKVDLLPLRILVAEDSESNKMLVEYYLKDTPFRVTYVESGLEAVDSYKKLNYDLVFMDIQMPEMDGYDATGHIRKYEADRGYPATPIIALTANTYAEDKQRCLDAGCSDYLPKPIKKIALIKMILKYCS